MKFHSIGYLLKEGVKSLWTNRTMSIASIGVLISCLLLTGVAGVLTLTLSSTMKSIEGNNSLTVFLEDDLPPLTSAKVGEEIRKHENVTDFVFIPKDDGLASIMNQLGDDGTILQGLMGDDNFLPDAYKFSMKDLSLYEETEAQIYAMEGVARITDYGDIATKLSDLERLVRYASIAIVAILGIVALFIISNTVKVTMFSRRTEINIMKSVGATNGFVRIPFIVEGLVIGIVSGMLSATLLYFGYDKAVEVILGIVPFIKPFDSKPYTMLIFSAYALVGSVFGMMGGVISISKYLKKEGENAIA